MPTLRIKVVPGSSRNKIDGWLGDALKIRVTANPEKGRANAATLALLAGALGIPRRQLSIISGASSPEKTLQIKGLSEREIHIRLRQANA